MDPQQQYTPTPTPEQPAAPQFNASSTPDASSVTDPGRTTGIVGFIFAFVIPLAGLIISLIAKSKSKKAGFKNGLAQAGIILSAIFMVISLVMGGVILAAIFSASRQCQSASTGSQTTGNTVTVDCSDSSQSTTSPSTNSSDDEIER